MNEYKKLKFVVIGLGHQSLEDHLPAISHCDGSELIGVSDIDPLLSEQIAKKYDVPFANSAKALLEKLDTKPDVALLAVPHKDYLPLVTFFAEQGIDIIKEKPFAISSKEAGEMIALARKHNILIQVTLQRRYNPIFLSFKQLINRIGKIYSIEARYTLNIDRLDNSWRSKKMYAGGGALIDLGYHYIDLIVWYFGLPDSVNCRLSTHNREGQDYDVEDTAFVSFSYNDEKEDDMRVLGNLVVSRVYPEKDEGLIAYGSKGAVVLQRGKVSRINLKGEEIESLSREGGWPSAIDDQLDEFIKNIHDNKNRGSIDSQHLDHVAFIEASYASAEKHESLNPRDYRMKLREDIQ